MKRKILFMLVIFTLLCGCKKNSKQQVKSLSISDTIFFEANNKVDTILLKTNKQRESVWINEIIYKKDFNDNFFMIASSLSHNAKIVINNLNGLVTIKVLGTDLSFKNKKFKNYDFLITEDSIYNSGNLYKIVNTFLVNDKGQLLRNEEFKLTSTDDGKTYDVNLDTIIKNDSIFLRVR